MAKLVSNNLVPQVHIPQWQWTRQAPVVSAAGASSCNAKNSTYHPMHGRFIYYLFATANFWRYDTITDAWMQLSSPPNAVALWSSMVFRGDMGVQGRVLAAASGSVTLPTALAGQAYKTYEIEIIGGTGIGQRRVISDQAPAVVADAGVATAVTTQVITDTTKAWAINQYVGYTVRVTLGTGYSQQRRIIANDATSLSFNILSQEESSQLTNCALPTPALVVTAGLQAVYQIESTVCTVETNWLVTPDETSRFEIRSGAILMACGVAGGYYLQQYSVAEDLWYILTSAIGLIAIAPWDGSIGSGDETHTVRATGLATGGTTTTLVDATQNWAVNSMQGSWLYIFGGTGEGQLREVLSNTATTITWATVGTAPTTTSRYRVYGLESGTVTTGGSGVTVTDSAQTFSTNRYAGAYQLRILTGLGTGQVRRIISNTATVITVDKAITTDTTSVYVIQPDASTVYLALSGHASVFRIGVEHGVSYYGVERDFGLVAGGTAQYSDWRPISIVSGTGAVGTITVTTTAPHGFKTGWVISHKGDTGASAGANNIAAAITVTGATTYTYAAPGSTAAWTITAQSTTTLKDASKNWAVNEHAGRIVSFLGMTAFTGAIAELQIQIASNTANTLTFVAASSAPVVGNRYNIADRPAIGALDSGLATGTQSTTTLQDTSKTWAVNQWAGRRLRFLAGAGQVQEVAITSNTSNTLTFGAVGTAPLTGGTSYSILAQPVRGVGIEMALPFNTSRLGDDVKNLFVARGGGAIGFDVIDLTTGAMTLVPVGQQFEALGIGSMYCYDGRDRIYFQKDATNRIYYLDVVTGVIYPAGQWPYVVGTAIVGNRMDIVTTVDGLKFLYVNRHSNVEMFRTLLFW